MISIEKNILFYLLAYILILVTVNYCLSKKKFLLDNPILSKHKLAYNLGVPLSGGIIILISILFVLLFEDSKVYSLFFFSLLFFFLGFLSDKKKNFNPFIRLNIQIILITIFVLTNKLSIPFVKIPFFDTILENKFFNIIFVIFCFVTFLNGLNFIDGINGLSIGYLIFASITIKLFIINNPINLDYNIKILFDHLILALAIFYLFNIFGKCFMGDNGIYLISILISYIFVEVFRNNYNFLSPYFIASLLWYPAFENLFTIIRRYSKKKKLTEPDNLHIHYLLFIKIQNKFKNKKVFANSLSGFIILAFFLPNFFIAYKFFNDSKILSLIIIMYIILYILFYKFLSKKSI